jgi:Cytochrome P450
LQSANLHLSDTVTATLTYTFYNLAKNAKLIENLRAELDPLQKGDGDFDLRELGKAVYLNGVINETLRLHPPVPSGLLRLTPPEGLTINGTYIPGKTTVLSPPWTVSRSKPPSNKTISRKGLIDGIVESCYVNPLEYLPERWTPNSPLMKDKSAFAPFSLGKSPYSLLPTPFSLSTHHLPQQPNPTLTLTPKPRSLRLRRQTTSPHGTTLRDRAARREIRC